MSSTQPQTFLRPPAEIVYARELDALAANDQGPKPTGWKLSPRSVRTFIVGSDGKALAHTWEGEKVKTPITRKFYGDDVLIERAVISLAGNRGLLLVGEPGTAKSMLSELMAAAISGISTNTIQGTAGTTEDQIKYSWNYALLLAEGPTPRALVPAPLFVGMSAGILTRFEEITRCPQEIQDTMVSILSDKVLMVPELDGEDRVVLAKPGFNVIATANIRDRGVNEMSSALKRRFNFETVQPIRDLSLEVKLVMEQTERLLAEANAPITVERDVVELLVTTFHELREGTTAEGKQLERPSTTLSTAEAVSVGLAGGLDAYYYGDQQLTSAAIVRHLAGAVIKDNTDDLKRLRHYFDTIVQQRSQDKGGLWETYYQARKWLG
ncbi:MAG TPA: AAA family ATPase [Ktedonobacterales bacterium]|nr:AAA family ATPase [Ktedonobacterales bacterium]